MGTCLCKTRILVWTTFFFFNGQDLTAGLPKGPVNLSVFASHVHITCHTWLAIMREEIQTHWFAEIIFMCLSPVFADILNVKDFQHILLVDNDNHVIFFAFRYNRCDIR